MTFDDYLTENLVAAHSALQRVGIKVCKDHETGERSATVEKDHAGSLKVAKLHNHLNDTGWKHEEHPSGHVYKHPTSSQTVTIYHKGAGANGHQHHEIVLGKH